MAGTVKGPQGPRRDLLVLVIGIAIGILITLGHRQLLG